MIVYSDYVTFIILGVKINLISNETVYGRNTVAEINGNYHYLNNEFPTIAAAVFTWQELNNRDLSSEELNQVMQDNKLISQAI